MSTQLTGSVGRPGKAVNNGADVRLIQQLLTAASAKLHDPALDPKGVDGSMGNAATSNTLKAIEAFQARFTSVVDGVIDVDGQTFQALVEAAGEAASAPTPTGPAVEGTFCFPFPRLPAQNWTSSPRSFGSNRSNGSRLHAGCDLYFPRGTTIHAVADGVVVRGPYAFYAETYALEVDHGTLIARYGEIQQATTKRAGDRVSMGEKIASVGHLVGITVPSDMLHFELYNKTATGPLTVTNSSSSAQRGGVPFMRRKDLVDPTSYLNQWQHTLPPA